MSAPGTEFLAGGGESGALMRSIDWSASPLGEPAGWPRNLKAMVEMMLASRFAMRVLWGPELIFLYNDGYRPILGAQKHPMAMGSRTRESFREVWDVVGPLFHKVLGGESFALDDYPLPLERNGYLEECYFTLSYSPIRDDDGAFRGVLGVVHETTERVLSARRLRALRDLAAAAANARTAERACVTAAQALAKDAADAPFALFYLTSPDGRTARLAASTAQSATERARIPAPEAIALDGSDGRAWPLFEASSERRLHVVHGLVARYGELLAGPFPEPIHSAVVLALGRPGAPTPLGFVVAGVNPRQRLDDSYRGFFELASEHVLTAIRNARSVESELARGERRRVVAEDQRSRLHELFMQAPAGICVLEGPDFVFELANPRYVELVGREVLGQRIADALPELAELVIPLLEGVRATGQPFHGDEVRFPLMRGGQLLETYFNFIYQPIRDSVTGGVRAVFVVAFEVTEQIMARKRAEELSRSLEVTNRELDQFAYVASHDLKTPLRGIANLADWIEEGLGEKMDEEGRRNMGLLRGRIFRLEALINGILAFSRAGRGRLLVELVDLGALLREVRDLLSPAEGVTIDIGPLPVVRGERVPLQQVFLNLVANAIKYGRLDSDPGARIEVTGSEDDDSFEVVVKDHGPGIAPRYQDRIWVIFQTLETRNRVDSTGIGLAIVKKIVDTRGGRVWVESAEGAGAAFHVRLPKG